MTDSNVRQMRQVAQRSSMNCEGSKRIFDVEWCHDLLREANGVMDTPKVTYSAFHEEAVRMAKVLEARLATRVA